MEKHTDRIEQKSTSDVTAPNLSRDLPTDDNFNRIHNAAKESQADSNLPKAAISKDFIDFTTSSDTSSPKAAKASDLPSNTNPSTREGTDTNSNPRTERPTSNAHSADNIAQRPSADKNDSVSTQTTASDRDRAPESTQSPVSQNHANRDVASQAPNRPSAEKVDNSNTTPTTNNRDFRF